MLLAWLPAPLKALPCRPSVAIWPRKDCKHCFPTSTLLHWLVLIRAQLCAQADRADEGAGENHALRSARPLSLGVGAMHRFLLVLLLPTLGVACATLPSSAANAVGLWQFPNRDVWIQINADGSTFQCRHAPGGTLFTSRGTFIPPHSIKWQDIWGTDQVSLANGLLTLSGKWGTFSYAKAEAPIYKQCLAPDSQR